MVILVQPLAMAACYSRDCAADYPNFHWAYPVKAIKLVTLADGWHLKLALEFKLNDAWIGAYWARTEYPSEMWATKGPRPRWCYATVQHLWVIIVPCFPFHFRWRIKG